MWDAANNFNTRINNLNTKIDGVQSKLQSQIKSYHVDFLMNIQQSVR